MVQRNTILLRHKTYNVFNFSRTIYNSFYIDCFKSYNKVFEEIDVLNKIGECN